MAMSGHPVARNRLPLCPRKQTFSLPSLTSGFDPTRTLALLQEFEHGSLTTLREKLAKIGATVVSHGRYVTFQMDEVAVSRKLFADILRLIDGLRQKPAPR